MSLRDIARKLRGAGDGSSPRRDGSLDPDLIQRVKDSGYFDAAWYCEQYPDVSRVGVSPLDHYLRIGAILRRRASEHFDTAYYLDSYPEVAASGANPLVDFIERGMALGRKPRENSGRVALVVHVGDVDALGRVADHLSNVPAGADQFLTYPDRLDPNTVQFIRTLLPDAELVPLPERGQDIGALMELARKANLSRYDAICKIHCQDTSPDPGGLETRLAAVLGGTSQVEDTIRAFGRDPRLMLAGPEQMYRRGPDSLDGGADDLRHLFGDLIGDFDLRAGDWGFLSGGCYWVRSSALEPIRTALDRAMPSSAAPAGHENVAPLAERMLGLLAALRGGRVRLQDGGHPGRTTTLGAALDAAGPDAPAEPEGQPALVVGQPPRGGLDPSDPRGELRGWLAVVGSPAPRKAVIRIDSAEFVVTASTFRADLQHHGVNEGNHGFSLVVPMDYLDGQPHSIVLSDEETGREIARSSEAWAKPVRDYWDFQGFLKSTMTMPLIRGPFLEEDKRAFAVMEGIANRMARRGLADERRPRVSGVMPMYNRATVVGDAIRSVLGQSYPHIELLVVDDGSVDESVAVVRSFADPRIRVIELGENRGVAVARNAALRAAQGEIICYLDTDNTWDERYVAAQVGAFDELPEADLIYSGILLYAGEETGPYAVRYGHFHPALLENTNYIDNNVISHRRSFLDRLGGFDDGLRRFVDYDLILRAAEVGRVVSVPMLLCHYYYRRVDNSITADPSNIGYLEVVRSHLADRQARILDARDEAGLDRPVSVVIPNWESLDDVRDCLDALRTKDWQGLLEVLVVDNGSSPPVQDYLQAEHDAGRIRFIPLGRNFGFTHAVNVGIREARGDSDILLLNNDAIAQPGSIQALQQACLRRPQAGMTVPRQILPSGTKTMRTHVPSADERFACDVNISAHHRNVADVPVFYDGSGIELTYAAFFAVYIRREVIEAIGPLDAEYGRHYRSDRVYSDMMRNLTGYRLYYAPDSHFVHKLQKATDHLRNVGQKDDAFDLMFRRNMWDAETARELGFRNAPWNLQ
ncbi:MAG TPA: glycosyltransferase [Rubellimicrobium sp.]|nr:glycosyltransferase [Rubellimicrobium sp.]